MIRRLINFLTKDVWLINIDELPKGRSFLIQQLRILILAARGFKEDQCQIRGSALTIFTLLSVVPVLAMAFGIAQGFGLEQRLEAEIHNAFDATPEISAFLIDFASSALNRTQGGLVAGIGVLILLWSVISVLGNIEAAFNEIWGVKKSRNFFRKFSDYLAITLVAPFLIILSSSITVFIASNVASLISDVDTLSFLEPLIKGSLNFLPYVIVWLVFSLLYIVMPNTKVRFVPALIAGIVAGTAFQIFQEAYIAFQVYVTSYNAIYGSFAALPLFIIWLQISWILILFGAELSFAHQNVRNFEFESGARSVSSLQKLVLSVLVFRELIRAQVEDRGAMDPTELSKMFNSPIRLIGGVIDLLEEQHLVTQVISDKGKEENYIVSADYHDMHLIDFMRMVETAGNEMPLKETELKKKVEDLLSQIKTDFEGSSMNVLLKDI